MAAPSDLSNQELDFLTRSLDVLLERYLLLLNVYQNNRNTLTENLAAASGHLSLAQANFSNPNRIHYGQDYYDERMRASTRVFIDPLNTSYRIVQSSCSATSVASNNDAKVERFSYESASDIGASEQDSNKDRVAESDTKIRDPLNWTAVVATIPELASVEAEMRRVEIEVRRTRKKLKKPS